MSTTVRRTVEHLLSVRFGTRVRIAGVEEFPFYPQVSRCTLETLAAWCERMVRLLRARWPEATEALPLYPAFE
ncbi:MAG: hypothetical protein HY332_09725 [Chloroflexi bacterium]|nr:hypothetical protein [Chloroflexota bacterium]